MTGPGLVGCAGGAVTGGTVVVGTCARQVNVAARSVVPRSAETSILELRLARPISDISPRAVSRTNQLEIDLSLYEVFRNDKGVFALGRRQAAAVFSHTRHALIEVAFFSASVHAASNRRAGREE